MKDLPVSILVVAFAVSVARADQTNAPAPAAVSSTVVTTTAESNALPTSITINGTTYEDVRWKRATPATVTIYHRSGVATIPLAELPPDLQRHFGYDPQKAADYQSQAAAAAARLAEQNQARAAASSQPLQEKAATQPQPVTIGEPDAAKGVWAVRFEPVGDFSPKTPREFLARIHVHSGQHGEIGYFRTTRQGDKLVGSFLAYDADQLKAALGKVPGIKVTSVEKLTQEQLLEYEKSPQESLQSE